MLYIEIVFSPGHLSSPSPNPYIFIIDSSSPFLAPVICLSLPSSACHHHLLLAITIVIIVPRCVSILGSVRCLLQTVHAFFKLLCSICYPGDQAKFLYGINFELSTKSISMVRCVSEFLEMTEEYVVGNLVTRSEANL
ncbi:unnamed protein product [Lactuca virosa]|uniref:Uncharacterized protein n=1 Tax=Lactuca virosa TaxID=75947 RepID=A0AAU9NM87_9ASTR|nr:unnamed protein product [Lactuca virosa]